MLPKAEGVDVFPKAEGVEVLPNAGALDPPPNADGAAVLPNAFAGFEPLFALPNADAPPPNALKPPEEGVEADVFPNAEAPKPDVEPNAGLDDPNADGAPNAGALLGCDTLPNAGLADVAGAPKAGAADAA